jgi:hypothetical protein
MATGKPVTSVLEPYVWCAAGRQQAAYMVTDIKVSLIFRARISFENKAYNEG